MAEKKQKVSLGLKAAYGSGTFGINLTSMAIGSYITAYYTDTVLVAAAFVGTMMLLTRCLDGISDIVMGIIIDHTHSKFGKARPWVMLSAIPCAISLILVFSVPSGLGATGKMIYIYVTYILSQVVCGTAGALAVNSLCTYMSPDIGVRNELTVGKTLGANLGSLLATSCTMMVINAFGGGQKGYTMMAVAFGVACAIMMFITAFTCKEYKVEAAAAGDAPKEQKEAATPVGTAVRILLSDRNTWVLTGCYVFNWLALTSNTSSMVYYARDVLHNSGYVTYLAFAISLPAIIILLLGIVSKLTAKIGKRKSLMIGAVLQAVGFGLVFILPTTLMNAVIGLVIRTFGLGIYTTNLHACVPDLADYIDLKNNVHIAGTTNSITSFGMKVGVGLGSAVTGWVLAAVGYSGEIASAGGTQSALTILGERLCYVGIPAIFCLIVLLLSHFTDIDSKLRELRASRGIV